MAGCASSQDSDTSDDESYRQSLALPRPNAAPNAAAKVAGRSVVPGQLVVKFKSDARAGVTYDVQSSLEQGRSFASITADRSSSLDEPVRRHGIFRATSLFHGREGLSTEDAKALMRSRASKAATARGRGKAAPLEDLINVYRLDLPRNGCIQCSLWRAAAAETRRSTLPRPP